jgi:N,N'-diacetyllegionaminate synthase
MNVLIIAEAGVNHNGDIEIAKSLIDAAADAKADIVKFQTFSAERQVTNNAPKAQYQKEGSKSDESQFLMLKKLELSEEMHFELIKYCETREIGFLSTGFDIQSVDFLNGLNQKMFKIPSGEITNLPYLRHIGRIGKPVLLSTGMSNLKEVKAALDVLEKSGTARNKITVLQCTSSYPAPKNEANLTAMNTFKKELNVAVGFSDHTLGIDISLAAVALGATVIEKHFTLDKSLPGPDHKASLEPNELKEMIVAIRNIQVSLGDGVKKVMPSEIPNIDVARKSLVAKEQINNGDIYTSENITTKRPGTGVSPMFWDQFLGKKASRNYDIDDLIIDES